MAPPFPPRPPGQPKGWLATVAIAFVMVGIVAGGCVAMGAVADLPEQPIEVARGVIVELPVDWQFGGRADDEDAVLVSRGGASVAIYVEDGSDERAALGALRDEWLALETVTVGDIGAVDDVRGGQPAARFTYFGTFPGLSGGAVEGEVTGVRGTNLVVVFDAWAGQGDFVNARADVTRIIDRATIP